MMKLISLGLMVFLISCSGGQVEWKSYDAQEGWIARSSPGLQDAFHHAPFDLVIKNKRLQTMDSTGSKMKNILLQEALHNFFRSMGYDTSGSMNRWIKPLINQESYSLSVEGGREGMAFTSAGGGICLLLYNPYLHEREYNIRFLNHSFKAILSPQSLHYFLIRDTLGL